MNSTVQSKPKSNGIGQSGRHQVRLMAPNVGCCFKHMETADGLQEGGDRSIMSTLGDFIRERRQDLGLTQEQLAERIGTSVRQADVSRLERNRVALPRRTRLEDIARALDVSLADLLVQSGWGTAAVQHPNGTVDAESLPEVVSELERAQRQLLELRQMFDKTATLLAATERTVAAALQQVGVRPELPVPVGIFDRWESAAPIA
jgi:transcriptional regulator with XRE-family HTH domain